uniref:Uncharacterized protein n=1 Tax=Aegilops tauschii subsp. strangulata TaxID=200361 RepID=A0A452YND5_AEGTS
MCISAYAIDPSSAEVCEDSVSEQHDGRLFPIAAQHRAPHKRTLLPSRPSTTGPQPRVLPLRLDWERNHPLLLQMFLRRELSCFQERLCSSLPMAFSYYNV